MAKNLLVMLFLVGFVFVQINGASTHILKRSLTSNPALNESTDAPPKDYCTGKTPCGWGVYNTVTRFIEYFMKNKCDCLNGIKECIRDEDDISITAYVYRCKRAISEKPKS